MNVCLNKKKKQLKKFISHVKVYVTTFLLYTFSYSISFLITCIHDMQQVLFLYISQNALVTFKNP